jgi:hypothetical protein
MPVRKTEARLPALAAATELGQAATAADGRCTLVSFVTSPLAAGRVNDYVVFVTDPGLAAAATSYEWTFTLDAGSPTTVPTALGEATFTPPDAGSLAVAVRIRDGGGSALAQLSLTQDVVQPSPELEDLIEQARNQAGPAVSHPDVARELVNDHNPYYQNATPTSGTPDAAFRRLLFSVVLDGALRHDPARRRAHVSHLAAALNDDGDLATLAGEGVGVSGVRLPLLAMVGVPAELPWTEVPETPAEQAHADLEVRTAFAALSETSRIDLFNLARFPKSNVAWCGRILEALRDRYFAGASFDEVLTGMSGTRAHWIVKHFREGPLRRA